MQKKYAKNRFAKRHDSAEPVSILLIFAIFLGVLAISVSAYWIYTHEKWRTDAASWLSHSKSSLTKSNNNHIAPTAKVATANADPNGGVRFDFYTELPNMHVNVPSVAVVNAPSPTPIPKPAMQVSEPNPAGLVSQIDHSTQALMTEKKAHSALTIQYYLQLGIFNNPVNASQLRLSLLLAGVEAAVVQTDQHTYRVQQGPYDRESQAKKMQQRLSNKGFDSSVIKQTE